MRRSESRLVFRPKLAGRHADFAPKSDAQILNMHKCSAFGDLLQGQVRLNQKLFHAGEADSQNFLVRRAAKQAFETAFQKRARLGNGAQDVFYFDAIAGVIAYEMNRSRDVAIFENQHIGGLARGDAERRNQVRFAANGFAGDHFVEKGGGFVAGALDIGNDAGKRRVRKVTKQFVVIDADDGDFVGHSDADAAAGVEDLASAEIITGHDADRFGERENPFGEIVHLPFVVELNVSRLIVNGAMAAGGAHGVLEMFATPFGPVETGIAGERKMFETAFQEVIGGEMGDGAVVSFEPGQGGDKAGGAHIDDGQ